MNVSRLAIAALLAVPALASDLFPLQSGNVWTYREAASGQTFTVKVGAPYLINQIVYYRITGYASSPVLARIDGSGNLVHFDEELDAERLLTSFEPFEGGWWEAPLRQCDQQGQTRIKRSEYDGPAGPINGVLHIAYQTFSCADAGTISEQYAENIGMVRRVSNTIAGPRQYDLVYARAGKTAIDAELHGRFTVTADLSGTSEFATATLLLETNSSAPVGLSFPSGQEYDVQVRDAAGNVTWTWSMDKLFVQASHTRSVAYQWSVTVQIPRRALPADGGGSIDAWLTSVPKFAASVPFAPPGEMTARARAAGRVPIGNRRK